MECVCACVCVCVCLCVHYMGVHICTHTCGVSLHSIIHLIHRVCSLTGSNWLVNFCHFLRKYLAVLSSNDGLHLGAKHLHIKALKHTLAIQFNATVQGNLSPKGKDNAVRTLISDHLRNGNETSILCFNLPYVHLYPVHETQMAEAPIDATKRVIKLGGTFPSCDTV